MTDETSEAQTVEVDPPVPVPSREEALQEDKEQLEEVIHQHHVISFTRDYCMLISHKTAYRRVSIKMTFLEDYPLSPVHIELKSETLPEKLLAKLVSLMEIRLGELELLGKPQVAPLYSYLDEMVHENKLLWATPEVRQCVNMSKMENKEFKLLVNEKDGTLKIRAKCGLYVLKATVTVPDGYPAEPVEVDITACSFPFEISNVYLLQAREIARKCSLGMTVERAVESSTRMTGQIIVPPSGVTGDDEKVKLSTAHLQDLKHDVAFLKQASDLRKVNDAYNKQLHKHDYSTAVRRAARRELRQLSKQEWEKEMKREQEIVEQAEKEQLREWKRLTGCDDSTPSRSVKAIVKFLTQDFIFRLPHETSAVSGEPVFPKDPTVLKEKLEKRKKDRPVRVPTCGCYFIFTELDKFITEPPFGKPCPRPACDGIVVQHPDWPHDIKKLEKAWAMKKAKEREIAEVTDLFGLDDQFKA